MKQVMLGTRTVGAGNPVYVIAEIGGNFRTVEQGMHLVDIAADAGCDAIKLQTYRADTITTKGALFEMENTGRVSQWELFHKYELDEATHRAVFDHARARGLFVFSTPSHPTDVDMLERLDVGAHKIGSDDAVNLPFLKYVANTGKPVLLSTGMCTMSEVRRAVDAILEEGNDQIVLFHCTTNYPTHPESVNLRAMLAMQQEFALPVGYSDHTLGTDTCYAAAVLGAQVLEFHFTHDKAAEGPDHMLSKDPAETADLVRKVRLLPTLLGDGLKRPMATEMNTRRNNRKSIVVLKPIRAGEKLTPDNIGIKRPGTGIACEHWYTTLGKTASRDLDGDQPLAWTDIL